MRIRRVAVALLLATLGGVVATAPAGAQPLGPTSPTVTAGPGWQVRMLEKVNAVRAAAGVPPVHLCAALERTASAYARQMASTKVFGHTDAAGRGPIDRMGAHGYRSETIGENIGAGQQSVVQVMRAWRASPSHLATLTFPAFRHVGFGFAPAAGDQYGTYWVQNFGAGGSCA